MRSMSGAGRPAALVVGPRSRRDRLVHGAALGPARPPRTERFTPIRLPAAQAAVLGSSGAAGEVWGAESAADELVRLRTD
jgi:streptogramin lyase